MALKVTVIAAILMISSQVCVGEGGNPWGTSVVDGHVTADKVTYKSTPTSRAAGLAFLRSLEERRSEAAVKSKMELGRGFQQSSDTPAALQAIRTKVDVGNQPLLRGVTDEFLSDVKSTNKSELLYLAGVGAEAGLPAGTLQTMWVAESKAGRLNVRNSSGYSGHFQIGDYEASRYCTKGSPFTLRGGAHCTVNLLKDYSAKSGIVIHRVSDAYALHNMGFGGAVTIRSAMSGDKKLPRNVCRNMAANTFKSIKCELFKPKGGLKFSHQATAIAFSYAWAEELERIKRGLGY